MEGVDNNYSEDKLKDICREKGCHLVFVQDDYNKINN